MAIFMAGPRARECAAAPQPLRREAPPAFGLLRHARAKKSMTRAVTRMASAGPGWGPVFLSSGLLGGRFFSGALFAFATRLGAAFFFRGAGPAARGALASRGAGCQGEEAGGGGEGDQGFQVFHVKGWSEVEMRNVQKK